MVNNIPVNGWPQLKDLEAVQPILNRLDKIEAWKRTVKEETFTGTEITIDNALALPARSLKTTINAIQDLHGYDKPWAGGSGKNKLPMTVSAIKAANTDGTWSGNAYTLNNTTFTILTDSADNVTGFKINTGSGGASDNAVFRISTNVTLPSGDYKFNGCTDGSNSTYFIQLRKAPNIDLRCYTTDRDFTYSEAFTYAGIVVLSGVSLTNKTVYPMIRLATESDASFAPWKNECPISGRTAVAVDDVGKNIWPFGDFTGIYTNVPFALKAGTYTLSKANSNNCGIRFFYGDDTSVPVTFNTSATITLTGDVVKINYSSEGATTVNFQLERGSTATSYQPYAHSSATLILGQTVYGADINWDTGVGIVDKVLTVVNNNSAISAIGSGGFPFYVDCLTGAKVSTASALSGVLSNYLTEVTQSSTWGTPFTFSRFTFNNDRVFFKLSNDITTVDAAKTYLASNPIQFCYELATPITIQLTPTQLELLKGYNHITLTDGYGTIELKALTGANWS